MVLFISIKHLIWNGKDTRNSIRDTSKSSSIFCAGMLFGNNEVTLQQQDGAHQQ
jgi:hypothetical protein